MKKLEVKTPRKVTSSVPRLTRQLAGIMAHLVNHPNDSLSKIRVSKIENILKGNE